MSHASDAMGSHLGKEIANGAISPQVFCDLSGQPLRVFVETSEFSYRPKLVRSLRKGGAVIAHYPTDAQVILVDLDTDAGKQFVEDWGSEPGKIVLDWQWARKSIDRGRALLANEDWGGCRVKGSHRDRFAADVAEYHPLPTPRPSPPDAGPSPQNQPLTSVASSHPSLSPMAQIPQGAASHTNTPSRVQTFGVPIGQAPQLPQLQQLPSSQVNGMMAPPHTLGGSPAPVPSAVQLGLFQWMIESLRPPGTNPAEMPNYPAHILQQLGLLSGSVPAGLSQPSPFVQPFTQYPGLPQASQPDGLAASDFMNPAPGGSAPAYERPSRHYGIVPNRSVSSSPPPQKLPSSLKRKTSPTYTASPSTSSRTKGKGRAVTPERPYKISRTSTPRSIADQVATPPSSQNRLAALSGQEGDLFKSITQESMLFYVQIETRSRGDLVSAIRKNGGKIVSDIPQADFVILAQHSKPFGDWLKRADQADKPAVQASYVYDCIAEGAILDVDAYLFEGQRDKPKRGRPAKSPRKGTTPEKKKTKEKQSGKAKVKERPDTKDHLEALPTHLERSPSPPQKVVVFQGNRNLFTAEEREYCDRYLSILITRDPEISLNAIAQAIHAKMPHHPIKSWRNFIGKLKEDINNIKKRVLIARRKAGHASAQQFGASSPRVSSVPPPEPWGSSLPDEESPEYDTFKTITEFLAAGGADDRTDEEVWEALAALHPFHTAAEWQDFWSEHGIEINAEVAKLMKQANGDVLDPAQDNLPAEEDRDDRKPKIEHEQ